MSDGEAVEKENAAPVAAGVEDKAAFLEKWSEGKKDASACRCTHMCLSSTQNLSRNLLDAVAKASVYQTAGKPFGDPKACVGPLSADLIEYLVGDADGAVPGESKAGVLSDLHNGIATWVESKRSFLNNFSLSSQTGAIDALKLDMSRGEGWKVTDRERVSRELLLRYDASKLAHCEQSFDTPDELYDHKLECHFRPVQCPNEGCAVVFSANAGGGHDSSCPHKVLDCPQGCGLGVPRSSLNAHMTGACERKPVVCPFAELGCDVKVYKGTLQTHCVECAPAHLALTARRVANMGESAAVTEAKLAAFGVSLNEVEPRVRSMEDLPEDVAALAARAEVSERSHAESQKILAGLTKHVTSLEAELKQTRKDLALVMNTVDRMVKAQERAAKEKAAAEKAAEAAAKAAEKAMKAARK